MVSIHGIVYLIVGVVVIVVSRTVNGMHSFFYVGVTFVAIGIAKLIFRYITREKKEKIIDKTPMKVPQYPQQQRYAQQQAYRCQRCGAHMGALFNFCSQCGARVR